jgi:hypothetical protein
VFGDEMSQGWRNYKDLRDGLLPQQLRAVGGEGGRSALRRGGGRRIGRHDQFYRFQVGRYNDWKVTAFYDETPQVFSTRYRSLWNGMGSGSLSLVSLTPGGTTNANTTQANIQNALAATPDSTLEVIRRKGGVRLDMRLSDTWKAFAGATSEKREGAQPFGAVFGGGGGGGNIEVAQSIEYLTHELLAGLEYHGGNSSFNLRASASFFRNDLDTMIFQNPLFITTNGSTGLAATTFTQGRFDLPPDNEHYNVKADTRARCPTSTAATSPRPSRWDPCGRTTTWSHRPSCRSPAGP